MTTLQSIVLGLSLICCTGGTAWLIYDMDKQIKAYREALKESTLGLVEEDDEE